MLSRFHPIPERYGRMGRRTGRIAINIARQYADARLKLRLSTNRPTWSITAGSNVPSTLGRYASDCADRRCAIHKRSSVMQQCYDVDLAFITDDNKNNFKNATHFWLIMDFPGGYCISRQRIVISPKQTSFCQKLQAVRRNLAGTRNLAIANRSRVSCAHNMSRASM